MGMLYFGRLPYCNHLHASKQYCFAEGASLLIETCDQILNPQMTHQNSDILPASTDTHTHAFSEFYRSDCSFPAGAWDYAAALTTAILLPINAWQHDEQGIFISNLPRCTRRLSPTPISA